MNAGIEEMKKSIWLVELLGFGEDLSISAKLNGLTIELASAEFPAASILTWALMLWWPSPSESLLLFDSFALVPSPPSNDKNSDDALDDDEEEEEEDKTTQAWWSLLHLLKNSSPKKKEKEKMNRSILETNIYYEFMHMWIGLDGIG